MSSGAHPRKIYSGWMAKKGGVRKNWKRRFFVLYDSRELKYYENEDLSNHRGTIKLSQVSSFGVSTEKSAARPYCLAIDTGDRTWVLAASSESYLDRWLELLEQSCVGHAKYTGWLVKRGNVRKSWKKRYFVIRDTQEMLYYANKSCDKLLGSINLRHVRRLEPGDRGELGRDNTICMTTDKRAWYFAAVNENEQHYWISILERAIGGAKRLITAKEGLLEKQGARVKNWKERYFVLSRGWLFYFANPGDCKKFKDIAFFSEKMFNQAFVKYVRGSIPLEQANIEKIGNYQGKDNCFAITTPKRIYYIVANTDRQVDEWLRAIDDGVNGVIREKRESEISYREEDYMAAGVYPELDEDEPETFTEKRELYNDEEEYVRHDRDSMSSDDNYIEADEYPEEYDDLQVDDEVKSDND